MTILKDKTKRQSLRRDLYQRLDSGGVRLPHAVKELRTVLGLDQADFAKMVGMSLSTLRKIEQSQGNVSLHTVDKILQKFSLELVVKRRAADII